MQAHCRTTIILGLWLVACGLLAFLCFLFCFILVLFPCYGSFSLVGVVLPDSISQHSITAISSSSSVTGWECLFLSHLSEKFTTTVTRSGNLLAQETGRFHPTFFSRKAGSHGLERHRALSVLGLVYQVDILCCYLLSALLTCLFVPCSVSCQHSIDSIIFPHL